jgi:hypothetical protein
MRGVVKVGVVLLVLLVGGLVPISINRVRNASDITQCQNNLRSIGLALHNYHDFNHHFPPGTLPNAALPPEKRLSWVVDIYPVYMEGGVRSRLDKSKAWDAEGNWPPRQDYPKVEGEPEDVVEELKLFLCPGNGLDTRRRMNYPGIAGVGDDAAVLELTDPRAGFFGYDRTITHRDIKDGSSTTLVVVEARDGGPWTAGGKATVRGLSPGGPPYLGEGGQFAGFHRAGNLFPLSQPVVTNALFVDGSVRRLTTSVSPQVFEALATIAGDDAASLPDE